MTTVTGPPLITPAVDVDELPAWDQPDERACELLDDLANEIDCPHAAEWIGTAHCDCPPARLLMCTPHVNDHRSGLAPLRCSGCRKTCGLTQIEAIR